MLTQNTSVPAANDAHKPWPHETSSEHLARLLVQGSAIGTAMLVELELQALEPDNLLARIELAHVHRQLQRALELAKRAQCSASSRYNH